MIKIKSVETFVYRFPIDPPVQTSFGKMSDRPMVIVRLIDEHNVSGFGEIWCNYPAVGAEHRAKLVDSVLTNLICSHSFKSPEDAFQILTNKTWVLCLQTGEFGPISQCIAGIDIAMHDLHARKLSQPLWKCFGGIKNKVETYASGISPENAEETAKLALKSGHNSLKLKIGFDNDTDLKNIAAMRDLLGNDRKLMVDANQSWTIEQAKHMVGQIEPYNVTWLEEPIAADRPHEEWYDLKGSSTISLAGGENTFSENGFSKLVSKDYLDVVQPDLAKWGGLTKTVPIARSIIAAKKSYCPHFLGGGIGLLASAHALAAVGGNGILEVDCNPNPLRTFIGEKFLKTPLSSMTLGDEPGLGVEPDLATIETYRIQ